MTALRTPGRRLRFVYEAGPCGFGIHRYLTTHDEDCVVVNPSSMPKRSGDRIKTDRRAREDAVGLSTQAKHRLKAFLLRQGRRYPGRAGWTVAYRRWLADR